MIGKLLGANRGERARRIVRACRRIGVATVAVSSEADAGALHIGASSTVPWKFRCPATRAATSCASTNASA